MRASSAAFHSLERRLPKEYALTGALGVRLTLPARLLAHVPQQIWHAALFIIHGKRYFVTNVCSEFSKPLKAYGMSVLASGITDLALTDSMARVRCRAPRAALAVSARASPRCDGC